MEDLTISGPRVFVCEAQGSDAEGNGTEKMPFKTILKAVGPKNILVLVRKTVAENYSPATKSALKKALKSYEESLRKAEKTKARSAKDAEDAQKQAAATLARLEESKAVIVSEDTSLPAANKIRIKDAVNHRNGRIKVSGWVHRLRVQGKDMMFIVLRDGYGFLQCVINGNMPFIRRIDFNC